jgi:rRNA maturation endonuclease Nob1
MTLVFDKAQKGLLRVQIASYMDDPKDAMNLTAQFSRLPDGTNHVSAMVIDGVSKQLNIAIQNANYHHGVQNDSRYQVAHRRQNQRRNFSHANANCQKCGSPTQNR